jgi:hypothetical protein
MLDLTAAGLLRPLCLAGKHLQAQLLGYGAGDEEVVSKCAIRFFIAVS